jgi:hypothetical protein
MSALSPNDLVPRLRSDVFIADVPPGTGEDFVEVKSSGSHAVRLRGFELSLARMLDGHHTAREVMERAAQVGLPLALTSLDGLIHEFADLGLLARSNAPGVSPWLGRTTWSPTERALFRVALRKARQGQLPEARTALDQLLANSRKNDDARKLRAALDHADPRAFKDAYNTAQREWLKHSDPTRSELKSVRSSTIPWFVMIGLLGCIAVTFGVPFPRVVTAPARLAPASVAPVDADHGGVIGEVMATEGRHVEAGATLFTYEDNEAVVAPAAGIVRGMTMVKGSEVFDGQRLMNIDDEASLVMSARLPSNARDVVTPGATATLNLGDHNAKATIEKVEDGIATATLDNSAREMDPGSSYVDIEVAPASIWQRFK